MWWCGRAGLRAAARPHAYAGSCGTAEQVRLGEAPGCEFAVPFVDFDADDLASLVSGGDEGAAGPCERVGYDAGRAGGDEGFHHVDRLGVRVASPGGEATRSSHPAVAADDR